MTNLKTSTATVETKVFTTDTHQFKIREETLSNLLLKNKYKEIIAKRLARGLRPIIDNTTGTDWQDSYNAIHEALVELDK